MSDQPNMPVANEFDSFWEQVEAASKLGGSGGTIAEVEVQFGWKVFVKGDSGFTNEQTFWPYQLGNDKSQKESKALANKFVVDHAPDKSVSNVLMLRMFKASVLNKDVANWKDDRWQFTFPSDHVYTTIIGKLRELGIKRTGKFWARIAWDTDKNPKKVRYNPKKDELGNTVLNEHGEPVIEESYPMFFYITEVFESKEKAMEAAGPKPESEVVQAGSDPADLPYPEGYDAESWAVVVAEIKAEANKGTPLVNIGDAFGMTSAWLTKALNS